jgi:DNA-binding beta-propeller fold protein YncE
MPSTSGGRTIWGQGASSRTRARLLAAVFGISVLGLLLTPGTALGENGDLTQKAGTAGCVSETGSGGACVDGTALNGPIDVTVSPDGKNVYAVSANSSAVVILDRNSTTGVLTQKPGTAGCVSEDGSGGACTDGKAMFQPRAVAISPDGASVYVASYVSSAVAVFDRDTTGALTQKPGTAGCVSADGSAGACTVGRGLGTAYDLAVSPDGKNVYVAAVGGSAIGIYDRSRTGALTQKPGTAGCVAWRDVEGCAVGRALVAVEAVVISPDGTSVYGISPEGGASGNPGAVAVFNRSTTNGGLTQKSGAQGCVSQFPGSSGCMPGRGLVGANGAAISPDGKSLYVVARTSDSVAIFSRSPTGVLSQPAGASGCVSDNGLDGSGGPCADGRALDNAVDVVVPDASTVYVGATGIAVFTRAADGTLAQRTGTAGCVHDTGAEGCADATALQGVSSLATSPNGHQLYVTAYTSQSVAVFDRVSGTTPPDTTPPRLRITAKPKARITTTKATITVSVSFVSEARARFTCKVDAKAAQRCSSPFKTKLASARGRGKKHTITIIATDASGNASAPTKIRVTVIRKA